ncbi:MAG: PIN domain-containing protein [Desulfurococcales archaeon]|nr:PIN domain-containing protein [Desulfurococcales archaeon]
MIREIRLDEFETLLVTGNELLVILDTSFLMAIGSGRPSLEKLLDIIEGNPVLIIPRTVLSELEKHSGNKRFSISSKASLALVILRKTQIPVYVLGSSLSSHADDDIYLTVSMLKNTRFRLVVATVDKELRRRIKTLGVPVVYLRRTENRFELG